MIFDNKDLPHKALPVVVTFGRFNPVTKGHAKLFRTILTTASHIHGNNLVFCSKSQDKKRNPLGFVAKINILHSLFPVVNFIASTDVRTPFQAIEWLSENGYKKVVFVVGDDRLDEFKERIQPYLDNNHPDYQFESMNFMSSGHRDEESEDDEESVSATKARQHAMNSKFKSFRKCLPSHTSKHIAKDIYEKLRTALVSDTYK